MIAGIIWDSTSVSPDSGISGCTLTGSTVDSSRELVESTSIADHDPPSFGTINSDSLAASTTWTSFMILVSKDSSWTAWDRVLSSFID